MTVVVCDRKQNLASKTTLIQWETHNRNENRQLYKFLGSPIYPSESPLLCENISPERVLLPNKSCKILPQHPPNYLTDRRRRRTTRWPSRARLNMGKQWTCSNLRSTTRPASFRQFYYRSSRRHWANSSRTQFFFSWKAHDRRQEQGYLYSKNRKSSPKALVRWIQTW